MRVAPPEAWTAAAQAPPRSRAESDRLISSINNARRTREFERELSHPGSRSSILQLNVPPRPRVVLASVKRGLWAAPPLQEEQQQLWAARLGFWPRGSEGVVAGICD